ncbi:hypothetical protein MGYG_01539 [Nannizzia gypsea CBS 118893]|uniref:Uncharacterized protein n=1 Tax=Arthroderma gypseum (strain ATCC MYA-4604 / CBS 118893) TaxID=535722 RepID=E5R1H6_ARTGP|nr:hypothetical protein MGYG_01539 [Nannizzia gypsea CBS 118893]EFQ98512.1 hypothetical protein MGYG_01539 [Nannizzia gypsea CBS 118893]
MAITKQPRPTKSPTKHKPACSALTYSSKKCKNAASACPASKEVPVCWAHKKLGEVVTCCQAPVGKNRKCMKKIPWTEIQLCFDHQNTVLPCHILRLPIELRQHIFSFVLAEYKRKYEIYSAHHTFLTIARLNRQLFKETSDLLYRKLLCRFYFWAGDIYIMEKRCPSADPGSWQKSKRILVEFDVDDVREPILNYLGVIADRLQGSTLHKLHFHVHSDGFRYSAPRRIEAIFKAMSLYLEPFRQVKSVREPIFTFSVEVPRQAELMARSSSDTPAALGAIKEWNKYLQELFGNWKRACKEDAASSINN